MIATWYKVLEDFKFYMRMERNFSVNTSLAYYADCKRFVDFINNKYPNIEPSNIETKHIDDFLESIIDFKDKNDEERILKATSQTRIIQSIRAYFKFMLLTDKIKKDISKLVVTPRLPQKLPVILEDSEIKKMMASIDVSTYFGYRNRLTIEFLYATGLRVSEFVNLKLQNIYFKEEILDIIGKGDKERYVPIAAKVLKDLDIYLKEYRSKIDINPKYKDYVFISQKRGTKLTRQFINKMLNETAANAGIDKKIHPHILRHSFATELIRGGANLIAVKEMMGHATIKSTEVYINLDTQDLKRTLIKCHPFYM